MAEEENFAYNKANEVLNKFNKEMIHGIIKRLFSDRLINVSDLEFEFLDTSEIIIEIPMVNYKNQKNIIKPEKIKIVTHIEIFDA